MKKLTLFVMILALVSLPVFSNPQEIDDSASVNRLRALEKVWVKVICRNRSEDGHIENISLVVVKRGNESGSVIDRARVKVNGVTIPFNSGIQEYMGTIGNVIPGSGVKFEIKTPEGAVIKGSVEATFFLELIRTPHPAHLQPSARITWKYSGNMVHKSYVRLIRSSVDLFYAEVTGSSYQFDLVSLGIGKNTAGLKATVASPVTTVYTFTGPVAPGSSGRFFATAAISL